MSLLPITTLIALHCTVTETGCWEWGGVRDKDGYGLITYDGETSRTHIEMLKAVSEQVVGFACHHCDNPPCCNPAHLYDGSFTTNAQDMILRKRGKGQYGKGENHPRSKLTGEEVAKIRATPRTFGSGQFLAKTYGVSPATISGIRNGKHFLE